MASPWFTEEPSVMKQLEEGWRKKTKGSHFLRLGFQKGSQTLVCMVAQLVLC